MRVTLTQGVIARPKFASGLWWGWQGETEVQSKQQQQTTSVGLQPLRAVSLKFGNDSYEKKGVEPKKPLKAILLDRAKSGLGFGFVGALFFGAGGVFTPVGPLIPAAFAGAAGFLFGFFVESTFMKKT